MDPTFSDLAYQETELHKELAPLPEADRALIERALTYADDAHQEHTRDEGVPYIIHPIRATRTLLAAGVGDAEVLAAALLHDVVEDATWGGDGTGGYGTLENPAHTFDDIAREFGSRVAELCRASTQDKDRESKQQYVKRIMEGPLEDRLIKAADKLDNVRSLALRDDRGERYQRHIREAEELHLPLARSTENPELIAQMEAAIAAIPDRDQAPTQ